jgi:hypothetical protein
MNNHCKVCGKHLTDFTSIKIGMGPICRARFSCQPDLGLENHSAFKIIDEKPGYIYIMDTGHYSNCKTVTNDVEWVLCEMGNLCNIDNRRIFYMDSDGQTDEILHKGKTFINFKAGHQGVEL